MALIFLVIYGPDCGHGFISDDYAWIQHGHIASAADLWRPFTSSVGFYRPLVSLSFGLNHLLFGLEPLGYGLTNLALTLACAGAVAGLAVTLGLTPASATIAASVWLFNFFGINMAVLWLSGRTSLLLTLSAILAAIAFLRGHVVLTAVAVAAALMSKEEAALLPLLFTVWAVYLRRADNARHLVDTRRAWVAVLASWLTLAAYLAVRGQSGAMWPATAPDYYRPAVDVSLIAANIGEYTVRSAGTAALAVLLAWLAVRQQFRVNAAGRVVIVLAMAWMVIGFGLTVFLPVRSSLYAVFPSAGAALAAAVLIDATCRNASVLVRRRTALAALALLVLLLPVYWSRNTRWTELADLSSSVVRQLQAHAQALPHGSVVLIEDDQTTRANLANAWAGLTPEMSALTFDNAIRVVVRTPESVEPSPPAAVVLRLERGTLVAR